MNQTSQHPPIDLLLPRRTVEKQAGISRATIYRMIKAGKFPHPVYLSVLAQYAGRNRLLLLGSNP